MFIMNMTFFQGICPGNRLRIVAGVFDASGAMQRRRTRTPAPVAHQPMPTQQTPAFTKVNKSFLYLIFLCYFILMLFYLLF